MRTTIDWDSHDAHETTTRLATSLSQYYDRQGRCGRIVSSEMLRVLSATTTRSKNKQLKIHLQQGEGEGKGEG
jgi:hypothetical protein